MRRSVPPLHRHLHRHFRCSVLHLQRRSGRHRAPESPRLRLRQRRRLLRHPPVRLLLQPQHRQEPLRLRRQQLLPAQEPGQRQLRLRRLSHHLRHNPHSILGLRVPIVTRWWHADRIPPAARDNLVDSAAARDVLVDPAAPSAVVLRIRASASAVVGVLGPWWGVDYSTEAVAFDSRGMLLMRSNHVLVELIDVWSGLCHVSLSLVPRHC